MRRINALIAFAFALNAFKSLPARADYPTVAGAGFHHCALIYDRPTRTPDDFGPYVAYDKSPAWLFDAFLFLIQSSGRGRGTEYGETEKVDWDYQLNQWFAAGRDLKALDDAIESASLRLGPPPAKRRVMFAIPYVNPAVKDFGAIGNETVNLSTAAGRDAAVRWYVSDAVQRFNAANYRHLELWGFYWMREDILGSDVDIARAASRIVHSAGYRLLWIPCNGETGYANWKNAGVDVAIYQPNYAFGTWQNGGRIGRNRIAVTADAARHTGLGVEMEAFEISTKPADQRAFAQYLADGAPSRYGYQAAPSAYYTSEDQVEQTSRSRDAGARKAYDNLARYVRNEPVADPDAPIRWRWSAVRGTRLAEARFPVPRGIAAFETFLDEQIGPAWRGIVEVSVLRPGAKKWTSGGWTVRMGSSPLDGRFQWIWTPVGGKAAGVRAAFRPLRGSGPLRVTALALDPNDAGEKRSHAALGMPYRFSPAARGKYIDSGHKLTDGIAQGGYVSGNTIGWTARGKDVAVCFDLGRVLHVSLVQAYTQGGGVGAVNWPEQAAAFFAARNAPPRTTSGNGSLPQNMVVVPAGPVVVDKRRSATDMDGHLTFLPERAIQARYVTLAMTSSQWLMLSEVRIFSNGHNIAPRSSYYSRPRAGAAGGEEAAYPDDGVLLTDGIVAGDFDADKLVAWDDDEPHTVTLDLGSIGSVREVTAWSLMGGQHGIYAPRHVAIDLSIHGNTWVHLGNVRPSVAEDGSKCRAIPCRVRTAIPAKARFVRVTVTRSRGWAMLSEIEVR